MEHPEEFLCQNAILTWTVGVPAHCVCFYFTLLQYPPQIWKQHSHCAPAVPPCIPECPAAVREQDGNSLCATEMQLGRCYICADLKQKTNTKKASS